MLQDIFNAKNKKKEERMQELEEQKLIESKEHDENYIPELDDLEEEFEEEIQAEESANKKFGSWLKSIFYSNSQKEDMEEEEPE